MNFPDCRRLGRDRIQRTKSEMLTRIIPLVLLGLAHEALGFSAPASLRSISGHSSTQGLASRPALRVPVLPLARKSKNVAVSMQLGGTATLARPELLQETARDILGDEGATCVPTEGGVNNMVQYVTGSDGSKYVMRIYNNGNNTKRVEFEHAILNALAKSGQELSFNVPEFLPSKKDGKTHITLSSGTQACVCKVIPGQLPKAAQPEIIGLAAGELVTALEKVDVGDLKSPTPPYYEIYDVHHAINKEKFLAEVKKPVFDDCRGGMEKLLVEFEKIEAFIEEACKANLPTQLIHADLHFDNVLWDETKVTGLLDFEFAAEDWRAMELAVCLSKYAAEKNPLELIDSFAKGYAKKGKLTKQEVEWIPEMINLRIMSNVLYFVGRALAGEDTIDALTTRADIYADRVVFIRENRDKIVKVIGGHMGTH